jgi:hypothetical protein
LKSTGDKASPLEPTETNWVAIPIKRAPSQGGVRVMASSSASLCYIRTDFGLPSDTGYRLSEQVRKTVLDVVFLLRSEYSGSMLRNGLVLE